MKVIFFIFMVGVGAAALILRYMAVRYRAHTIRSIADRYSFHYLGKALPRTVNLSGTPFAHFSSVSNVIDGDRGKERMVLFDCRVGGGRHGWSRTVVALSNETQLGQLGFSPDLTVDRSGHWQVIYQPKKGIFTSNLGLTPAAELESYVKAFRA